MGNLLRELGFSSFLGSGYEKLMYKEHVCSGKIINILRCLTGCSWGAGRNLMLMIYKAMIRSVFDYGCLEYGLEARSTLDELDVVQSRI